MAQLLRHADGVGTYTAAQQMVLLHFVPEPSFINQNSAVTVKFEDKNGTKASATYTPTVKSSHSYSNQ